MKAFFVDLVTNCRLQIQTLQITWYDTTGMELSLASYTVGCDIGRLTNFSNFDNRTSFTYDQFSQYVQIYAYYQCLILPALTRAGLVSFAVSGAVGLVAYMAMFAALRYVSINGCTLIYHKATVILELAHMVIMVQHGILQIYKPQIPSSYSIQFWFSPMSNGWAIGDSIKLAVSFLTTFLTMERFIAVSFAFVFKKFNKPWVAYAVVLLSMCIGSAQLWIIGASVVVFDNKTQKFAGVSTTFAISSFYKFTLDFIYAAKIALSIIIFVFCIATVVKLNMVAKKAQSLNSNAKRDWASQKKACTLTYILGITILLDHAVWVSYKLYKSGVIDNSGEKAVRNLTFDQALADLEQKKIVAVLELGQRLLGQLVHSWRFFLYLAFNKTMRVGFLKVFCKRKIEPVGATASGMGRSRNNSIMVTKAA